MQTNLHLTNQNTSTVFLIKCSKLQCTESVQNNSDSYKLSSIQSHQKLTGYLVF